MEIWIGAISSLVGVMVGSLLNFYTAQRQSRLENEWRKQQLLREKLEQIADMAIEISKQYQHPALSRWKIVAREKP
jgi:membrane protein DedA with SNARE-associated domain